MATKEEIFDWVIEKEDELLRLVRFNLKSKAYQFYGKDGSDVVDKYYRQIDGEEEFESLDSDDCDECKEKAKKLIENTDFLKKISEIIFSDKIDQLTKNFDFDKFHCNEKEIVDELIKDSCFKITDELKTQIFCRVILEICKRKLEEK